MNFIFWTVITAALLAIHAAPQQAFAVTERDALIKGSGSAVYYYAVDGKRYVFPTQLIYQSWFTDFNDVMSVTGEELADIPLGGNITNRPGIRMVKIQTDPKVYAIDQNKMLRWVQSETLARELYGDKWNTLIDDIPVTFVTDYIIGEPITDSTHYNPLLAANIAKTINKTLGLEENVNTKQSDTVFTKQTDSNEAQETDFETTVENAIHILTNNEREKAGLSPLQNDASLSVIAHTHSKDMAERDYFSHSSPERCDMTCRIENAGYTAHAWGENIAWRLQTPFPDALTLAQHFVNGWMNSEGHRENILLGLYTNHGIGVVRTGDTAYATANFSKK